MSILQFVRILIARRWITLATLVTCLLVAVTVAKLMPERYPAHARVLMDSFKPDPLTGSMIQTNALRGYVKTQIELIRDYRVAGDVVDKLGLANNPDLVAAFQSSTNGDGDLRRWIAERISENTRVDLVEGSSILEITYEASSPELAKRTVNALRESYIENSLRFRTDSAGRTAEWYQEQADRAAKAIQTAETAKAKFEQDNGIIITANGESENAKLASLQQALVAARTGEGAQQFAATMQAAAGGGLVDQLKVQLATLNDQIQQAEERLGNQHPTYKAMIARRQSLQSQISREEGAVRARGSTQVGASRQAIATLERQVSEQQAKVFAMRDKLNQDIQFQKEIDLRRAQYEKAAGRAAELKLEANFNDAGLVVLGDAIAEPSPSFPNWVQIISLAVGLGLGLGLVLGLFVELLNRRVRGAEDLRYAAKVPVFAVIGDQKPPAWKLRLRKLLARGSDATPAWQPAQ